MENKKNNYLINETATKNTKILYNYICDIYGNKILSGQQESIWQGNPDDEMEYILSHTGKLPAIRGLDYMDEDFDGVTKRSLEWWNKGGIVSICWHWGTPPFGKGYESSKGEIDLEEVITEGTELYNGMLKQMDEVAEELKKLRDADVPVLWRPFHEFDGAWFWWGKGGADTFVYLWKLMFERYTKYHGLNNLIWVLGYSGEVKEGWYPGDEYVDIIGADNYSEGIQKKSWDKCKKLTLKDIPITYHECGPIPCPEEMFKEDVTWSWFLTWHTIHIREQNTTEYINYIYNHDKVITLDKLPFARIL